MVETYVWVSGAVGAGWGRWGVTLRNPPCGWPRIAPIGSICRCSCLHPVRGGHHGSRREHQGGADDALCCAQRTWGACGTRPRVDHMSALRRPGRFRKLSHVPDWCLAKQSPRPPALAAGIPSAIRRTGSTFRTTSQATNSSTQLLLREGRVLGINDPASLLVLILVLGSALSVFLLVIDRARPST
jgi:hypothetical protein